MEKAVDEIKEENAKTERINAYSETDIMLQIYINRVLLLIYAVLYILLLLSLYIHRGESSIITSILVALFFLVYPFFVDFIGENLKNMFVSLKNSVYTGNALFMYKPKTTATY